MDISLLNIRILFQENTVHVDEVGNHTNGWVDFFSCYATVSGENGQEESKIGVITAEVDIAFTVRYCKKVSCITATSHRIVFNNEYYDIVSIDHMNFRKRSIKFKCKKVKR